MSDSFQEEFSDFDRECMSKALDEAKRAFNSDEVPVGGVITYKNKIIGVGRNQVEFKKDASKHAEMQCIHEASLQLDRWRLEGCTLYVTLEPCLMSFGAIVNARISRLIWATDQTRRVEGLSVKELIKSTSNLGPQLEIFHGLMMAEAKSLMQTFFKNRRQSVRKESGAIV